MLKRSVVTASKVKCICIVNTDESINMHCHICQEKKFKQPINKPQSLIKGGDTHSNAV